MKPSSKNWLWIFITIVSLVCFLFGTLVMGVKFINYFPDKNDLQTLINQNNHTDGYTTSTIALWITGIVFGFIVLIVVIIKSFFEAFNWKKFLTNQIWDYIFMGMLMFGSLLIVAGSGLFLDRTLKAWQFAQSDAGSNSMHFILVILPMLFSVLPLSVDWKGKWMKRREVKRAKK